MPNNEMKVVFDWLLSLPPNNHYYATCFCSSDRRTISVFIHQRCTCPHCGKKDGCADSFFISESLTENAQKWLAEWREKFEKENENDRGSN